MKRLLLILALLQAPVPTPQTGSASSVIISDIGEVTINGKPFKPLPIPKAAATPEPLRYVFPYATPTAQLWIDRGDEPQGPCNLGDLVRAAKAHLDREHPSTNEWMGAPGTTYMQTLAYKYCDYNPSTPACRVQRAEEALAAAKAAQDAEVKRLTILNTLRAELARCSPGGGK